MSTKPHERVVKESQLDRIATAKRKGGSRKWFGYRRFATAAEAIRFQWKSSPQCAPSARGCWSVTSASTARKSIACMRVMIILWDAERVNP
jgi:hypothetical protein